MPEESKKIVEQVSFTSCGYKLPAVVDTSKLKKLPECEGQRQIDFTVKGFCGHGEPEPDQIVAQCNDAKVNEDGTIEARIVSATRNGKPIDPKELDGIKSSGPITETWPVG